MTVTVRDLIGHRPLGITLLTSGFDDAEISWSHSSDLEDPSPFLEAGQLLLTTGRQFGSFAGRADYDDYVTRLTGAGVVALGFGTEVVRSGTPPELLDSCEAAQMALIELPYATPFIAVTKFIADQLAADSRSQLEWTLAAEEAISHAVLSSGGLEAAVRSSSDSLNCELGVLDSDGDVLEGTVPAWLRARALELLRRGSRARDSGESDQGFWTAHTLGRSGRLLGVVLVFRPTALSPAEVPVVTMLTALTELALEHAEDQRLGFRSIGQQLFGMLCNGGVDAVRETLTHHSVQLPMEPFHVIAVSARELPPTLFDTLERMAAGRGRRLFVVLQNDHVLLLADESSESDVRSRLTQSGLRAGISADADWESLGDGITQAASALAAAREGQSLGFEELMAGTVLGLLVQTRVADLARLRLGTLLLSPDGNMRLREAAEWLRCNGAWDPAARELGMHRHTLKQRIADLGRDLDIPLDRFQGRAELWALLVALDLTSA